jgi:hypothetical protein
LKQKKASLCFSPLWKVIILESLIKGRIVATGVSLEAAVAQRCVRVIPNWRCRSDQWAPSDNGVVNNYLCRCCVELMSVRRPPTRFPRKHFLEIEMQKPACPAFSRTWVGR